jgi:hypothetical protein
VSYNVISLYLHSGKWYDKKKPELQLKILDNLSSNKLLSKSQVRRILKGRHRWAEISGAFDILKTRGFIEVIAKDTSKHGKPEIFYRLTADGLAVLLIDNPRPDKFWSLLMHYCYSREDEEVSKQTIDDFYDFYSKRIFKFSSGHNSLIILDKVNDVCNDWLNRFRVLSSDEIDESSSVDSALVSAHHLVKVLEILVHHPDLTINELSLRLGTPAKALEKSIISMIMPSDGNFVTEKIRLDKYYVSKFREMFLEHCFIVSKDTEQVKSFKLSIFGIILFLTYAHRNYRNSPSFIKKLTEYYDAIALNYGTLLPLIFGKWQILKKRLEYMAMDFGMILDRERRNRGKYSRSILLDNMIFDVGVNEYYESMKNIVNYNSLTTKEIYNAGYNAFQEVLNRNRIMNRQNKSKPSKMKTTSNDTTKVVPVLQKVSEIWQMLRYWKAEVNIKELSQGQQTISPIETYSRLVQDEITFVYYLNLLGRHHELDLPFVEEWVNNPLDILDKPYEILNSLLEEDNEIELWFTNWMKDIRQYLNEISEIITNYEKTKRFVFKEERSEEEDDVRES